MNKYTDRVPPEYKMAMEAIGMFRLMLGRHRPEALLKAMDNFGGLSDPTLNRDILHSKSFEQQIRMVEAALKFLDVIDAVASEVESAETAKALDVVERDF